MGIHKYLFTAVLGVALGIAPTAEAQDNCKQFRALIQATWYDPLGTATPPSGIYGWQGPFMGSLDGQPVFGLLSPAANPGPPAMTGVVGKEGSPSEKLVFGSSWNGPDFLITVADNKGVFPTPPGKGGWLMGYIETAKIAEGKGSGQFAKASGTLVISGPGIAYPADFSNPNGAWVGIWNGEINGRICNVAQ